MPYDKEEFVNTAPQSPPNSIAAEINRVEDENSTLREEVERLREALKKCGEDGG